MRLVLATAVVLSLFTNPTMAEPTVKLHAAGSLKAAMSDIADLYEKTHGVTVVRAFGPSGLLRERIEGGEAAEVYASANMKHPTTLATAGRSGPVALFARNRLCALAQADLAVETETQRLGLSTEAALFNVPHTPSSLLPLLLMFKQFPQAKRQLPHQENLQNFSKSFFFHSNFHNSPNFHF